MKKKTIKRRDPFKIKIIRYQSNFYHRDGKTTTSYKLMSDGKIEGIFNVAVTNYHGLTLLEFLRAIEYRNKHWGMNYIIVNQHDIAKWWKETYDSTMLSLR